MTHFLEMEREGKRSDHSCDCKGSKDDAHTVERGKRGQDIVATTKGAGTTYGLEVERGGARGQITVVTVKGAGVTYSLEVEREGKR